MRYQRQLPSGVVFDIGLHFVQSNPHPLGLINVDSDVG